MKINVLPFNQLTVNQLYEILNLRNKVFVVEQNCPYLDTDYADLDAIHLMIYKDENLVSYARLIKPGVKYDTSSIGRVVVDPEFRNLKLGHVLIQNAIEAIQKNYNTSQITISAQAHLQKFYNQHGFKTISDEYLEDNIPHVKMFKQ